MALFPRLVVAAILSLAAGSPALATTTLDDFNRADSSDLGANWTQQTGASFTSGDRATGTNVSLATFNGGGGDTVSFDISNPIDGTSYVAGVLDYASLSDNYFIKIQNSGAGNNFDSYAFYFGNNGVGVLGSLSATFKTAHVTASVVGQVATLTIDPNIGAEQVYTHDYTQAATGTGIGLGFYGAALADNFGGTLTGGVPEPASWALMLVGFGGLGAMLRRRRTMGLNAPA